MGDDDGTRFYNHYDAPGRCVCVCVCVIRAPLHANARIPTGTDGTFLLFFFLHCRRTAKVGFSYPRVSPAASCSASQQGSLSRCVCLWACFYAGSIIQAHGHGHTASSVLLLLLLVFHRHRMQQTASTEFTAHWHRSTGDRVGMQNRYETAPPSSMRCTSRWCMLQWCVFPRRICTMYNVKNGNKKDEVWSLSWLAEKRFAGNEQRTDGLMGVPEGLQLCNRGFSICTWIGVGAALVREWCKCAFYFFCLPSLLAWW